MVEDLQRIAGMWSELLDTHGGPMLFGEFSIADAFYAPVCMRIRGYGLPVPPAAGRRKTANPLNLLRLPKKSSFYQFEGQTVMYQQLNPENPVQTAWTVKVSACLLPRRPTQPN